MGNHTLFTKQQKVVVSMRTMWNFLKYYLNELMENIRLRVADMRTMVNAKNMSRIRKKTFYLKYFIKSQSASPIIKHFKYFKRGYPTEFAEIIL
jgi:hypothetical protein